MEQLNRGNSEAKNDKIRKLEVVRKEVEFIVDKLGLEIDEGIKESVAVLRAMDFPTISSCAGHTNQEDDGYGVPYIHISEPAPKEWQTKNVTTKILEQWKQENLHHRQKMEILINSFYGLRQTTDDTRLVLRKIGGYEAFRIQSYGGFNSTAKTVEEAIGKIILYQKEMEAFTTFLNEEYFKE